jgi:CTP synthase (UTP-ammonia lyase)
MKNKILESLEDIVGQMQMNKVDNKTVLEVLKNIVDYETKPKKLSIGMVKKFTDNFDSYDSDVWILEMLSGDIDLDKMKATMLDHKNYPNVLDIYKKEEKNGE